MTIAVEVLLSPSIVMTLLSNSNSLSTSSSLPLWSYNFSPDLSLPPELNSHNCVQVYINSCCIKLSIHAPSKQNLPLIFPENRKIMLFDTSLLGVCDFLDDTHYSAGILVNTPFTSCKYSSSPFFIFKLLRLECWKSLGFLPWISHLSSLINHWLKL